jgi:hypothetical protein
MEQVYASNLPSIVKFGETMGPSIGVVVGLAIFPLLIIYKWYRAEIARFIAYNLLFIMPFAIGFFSQFGPFARQCAANYDVSGINTTLAYSTVNSSCSIVVGKSSINSTCFAQNILSSLSYKGEIYVYGNYTNYYTIQPSAPAISFTQNFMPWAPTVRNYDMDSTGDAGRAGQTLLIMLCVAYFIEWLILFRSCEVSESKSETGQRFQILDAEELQSIANANIEAIESPPKSRINGESPPKSPINGELPPKSPINGELPPPYSVA